MTQSRPHALLGNTKVRTNWNQRPNNEHHSEPNSPPTLTTNSSAISFSFYCLDILGNVMPAPVSKSFLIVLHLIQARLYFIRAFLVDTASLNDLTATGFLSSFNLLWWNSSCVGMRSLIRICRKTFCCPLNSSRCEMWEESKITSILASTLQKPCFVSVFPWQCIISIVEKPRTASELFMLSKSQERSPFITNLKTNIRKVSASERCSSCVAWKLLNLLLRCALSLSLYSPSLDLGRPTYSRFSWTI
jgi:hypothetical protein